MPPISQPAFKPSSLSVSVSGASELKLTNLDVDTPNTEFSHALQNNLKSVLLRARELVQLKISFVATESGTNYITLNAGCVLSLEELEFTSETIYIQSPSTTVVEIVELYT